MGKNNKGTGGPLHHLTKDEYTQGASLALQNAKEFIAIAEFCRDKGLFSKGAANSVFAMEELAKASYLQLKVLNPQIGITNLDSYFHKHHVKHDGIQQLVSVLKFNQINPSESSSDSGSNVDKSGIVMVLLILFLVWFLFTQTDDKQPANQLKSDLNRISKAQSVYELIRQMGLYVEFNEEDRTWTSPNDAITDSLFEDVFKFAQDGLTLIEAQLFGDEASSERAVEIAEALDNDQVLPQAARQQLDNLKKGPFGMANS